ncbi:MAG: Pycsar system effector family protein [Kofleriaceae bacterium]
MATVSSSGLAPTPSDSVVAAQTKYAKEVNSYINEYIRFADVKAGAGLTITIAVAGALGKAVPALLAATNNTSGKAFMTGLLLIAGAATAMSIIFATLALIPRVACAQPSLNSFPDIANYEPGKYADEVAELTERGIARNLSFHNVTLANVAMKKFKSITTAVRSLLVLLVAAFTIVVLYVLMNT